jgi:DNA-directed RNA polymerase subunit H (RpoH/RPB5)
VLMGQGVDPLFISYLDTCYCYEPTGSPCDIAPCLNTKGMLPQSLPPLVNMQLTPPKETGVEGAGSSSAEPNGPFQYVVFEHRRFERNSNDRPGQMMGVLWVTVYERTDVDKEADRVSADDLVDSVWLEYKKQASLAIANTSEQPKHNVLQRAEHVAFFKKYLVDPSQITRRRVVPQVFKYGDVGSTCGFIAATLLVLANALVSGRILASLDWTPPEDAKMESLEDEDPRYQKVVFRHIRFNGNRRPKPPQQVMGMLFVTVSDHVDKGDDAQIVTAGEFKRVVVDDYLEHASIAKEDTHFLRSPVTGYDSGKVPKHDVIEADVHVAFYKEYLVAPERLHRLFRKKRMQPQAFVQDDYGNELEFITRLLPEVVYSLQSGSVLTTWTRLEAGNGQLASLLEWEDVKGERPWRRENRLYPEYFEDDRSGNRRNES